MKLALTLLLFLTLLSPTKAAMAVAEAEILSVAQQFDRVELEKRIGRKLKIKERIAMSFLRGKAKRAISRAKKRERSPTDNFAMLSFILALLSPLLFFTGLIAVVFGIIALIRISRKPEERGGRGYAILGIIIGLPLAALLIGALFFGLDVGSA